AMRNLQHLDLSNNDIQGHIPDWIGEIGRNLLSVLNLANNSLTDTIPNVYEDWSELEGFILNGNQLEGKVPTSLNKCQYLRVIDLGNNQLSDTFPGWLGGLLCLQALILRSNNFYGDIVTSSAFKFRSLRVLDLSHNGFVGQLPTKYFQNFNAMKNVVKSNIKLEYVYVGRMYYSIIVAVKGVNQFFTRLSKPHPEGDRDGEEENGFIWKVVVMIGYVIGTLLGIMLGYLIVYDLEEANQEKIIKLGHEWYVKELYGAASICEDRLGSGYNPIMMNWNKVQIVVTGMESLVTTPLVTEIPNITGYLKSLKVLNLSHNSLTGRIPHALGLISKIESLDLS
ncbi:hypothetical protein M8C21_028806, partial [Ambrosia artemisiifolia]